jgi:predicted nucleic acid-binding protein
VNLVVDASVAVKWVLQEAGSEPAAELADEDMFAPDIWLAECASVLWRRARMGELAAEEAQALLDELAVAPVAPTPAIADLPAALSMGLKLGQNVYDCLYLALALRLDAVLVTADERFLAAVRSEPDLRSRIRRLKPSGGYSAFSTPASRSGKLNLKGV